VEKSAAAKARTRPTIASKKRTHTSGISRCRKRESRWKRESREVSASFIDTRPRDPQPRFVRTTCSSRAFREKFSYHTIEVLGDFFVGKMAHSVECYQLAIAEYLVQLRG